MQSTDALRALKLFNEKAEKLANSSFARDVFAEETGLTISGQRGAFVTVHGRGPSEDSIELFVHTLRFLIQDNDGCSFRCLASLYDSALVSDNLKGQFLGCRRVLNEYLDKPTYFKSGGRALTHRDVLNVLVYGGLSHADRKYKGIYDDWIAMGAISEIPRNILVVVLATFMNEISYAHDINAQAIVALGGVV